MSASRTPGHVAMVSGSNGIEHVAIWTGHRERGMVWLIPFDSHWDVHFDYSVNVRPLVVIDPEDREQVERFRTAVGGVKGALCINRTDEMQSALREFASPTPYRTSDSSTAPWPLVGECHSGHVEGHECPQCAWEHEHDWVAWPHGSNAGPGIPIRCTKCGGRKCDSDDCALMRHGHTHAEVTS